MRRIIAIISLIILFVLRLERRASKRENSLFDKWREAAASSSIAGFKDTSWVAEVGGIMDPPLPVNWAFFFFPLKISSTRSKSKYPVVDAVYGEAIVAEVFPALGELHFLSQVWRTININFLAFFPSCAIYSHSSFLDRLGLLKLKWWEYIDQAIKWMGYLEENWFVYWLCSFDVRGPAGHGVAWAIKQCIGFNGLVWGGCWKA